MNDPDIRSALHEWLGRSDPHAVVIDELQLCRGIGRADVVAVNGSLNGFEIKSDKDSLARFPKQIETYQSVFDYCHLVVGVRHLPRAQNIAPDGWGVMLVEPGQQRPIVRRIRKARCNRCVDTHAVVRLLWKSEVVRALRHIGSKARADTPVLTLWTELGNAPRRVVAEHVRESLKTRVMTLSDQPSLPCDDSSPTGAIVEGLLNSTPNSPLH